ncbi:jg9828 [Pararge aegeria aegeria]|uniref:Jg9828 protein n=1 Tax=Pararge aegeria aegeria TaxID=348720 RepID=A0A8S4QSL8_9NEOP|nr:jg9828 [Pararge aegeria aegeria]
MDEDIKRSVLVIEEKKRKTVKYCAAFNCLNTSRDPTLSFFILPVEAERRRKWLKAIDREDLLTKENLKPKSYVVCSAHFEKSAIKIVTKLSSDAIPTIFPHKKDQESKPNIEIDTNVATQTEPKSRKLPQRATPSDDQRQKARKRKISESKTSETKISPLENEIEKNQSELNQTNSIALTIKLEKDMSGS